VLIEASRRRGLRTALDEPAALVTGHGRARHALRRERESVEAWQLHFIGLPLSERFDAA
jgi:hypothetical protein